MQNMDAILTSFEREIHLDNVHGQLSWADVLLYYWSTRVYFQGWGAIVDGGALMGLSSYILAQGLATSNHKEAKILAYDFFKDKADGFTGKLIVERYGEQAIEDGWIDYENIYKNNLKPYEHYISIYKGDIRNLGYTSEQPIEIFSIDVAKTPDIMHSLALNFFPHLKVGSLVLHQDYIFPFNPWVNIAQELFADYFEHIYDTKPYSTAAYKLTKPITKEVVKNVLGNTVADFYNIKNLGVYDTLLSRAREPEGKILYEASRMYALFMLGEKEKAQHLAAAWKKELDPDYFTQAPSNPTLAGVLEEFFSILNSHEEK